MRALMGLVALVVVGTAGGQELPIWDRYPDEDVVVESRHVRFDLHPEGGGVVSTELVAVALTDDGRETLQSQEFDFNSVLGEMVVDEACSVDLEGTQRCTDPGEVVFEPMEGEPIIPGSYERIHVMVPLDEVRIGSRVTLRYHQDLAVMEDARFFGVVPVYDTRGPLLETRVEVRYQAERPVHALVTGVAMREEGSQGEWIVHRWTLAEQPATPPDSDRPRYTDLYPVVYLSEFDTWEAFGQWYAPQLAGAAERFGKRGARQVSALAEPRMSRLDPVIKTAFLVSDRTPTSSVGLELGTMLPGSMDTIVTQAGTQTDRALALMYLLREEGVDGVHLAFATRERLKTPATFPCPLAFQEVGVHVAGRGFIDPDNHPDYADSVYSDLRGGGLVVLDEAGPRVLSGEDLDPPADRPGWHREGRLTVSGGELRVEEELTFSGSARTAARSLYRDIQDDLEDEEKLDRMVKRAYNRHFRKAPEETYAQVAVYDFAVESGYASGVVREATFFDPWDPRAETTVELRYAAEDAIEVVADLVLVRPPFVIEDVSRRCTTARPDRESPVRVSKWDFTYRYDFVIPEGYELVGTPADQELETPYATLRLHYREAMIAPREADEGDGDEEEAAEPAAGVVIEASYTIHQLRVPLEEYEIFRQVAARHALSFRDPIVLRMLKPGPAVTAD